MALLRANSGIEYPVYPMNNHHFNVHQKFNVSSTLDELTLFEVMVNKTKISQISSCSQQACMTNFTSKKDDLSFRDIRKIYYTSLKEVSFKKLYLH